MSSENIRITIIKLRYLMRERNNKFALYAAAAAGFACVVIYAILLRPLSSELTILSLKSDALQLSIEENRDAELILTEYKRLTPILDNIDEKLSVTFTQAELSRRFDALASLSGVSIANLSTRNGEPSFGYYSYINEFTLKGQYPAIRRMIMDLRELPGLNSINELALTKDRASGDVVVVMVMTTYRKAI